MSGWPRSLFGRLLAIATLATLAALVFAGVAIGGVLERFVMRGLDDRLDAQVTVLTRAVGADGRFDPRRAVTLPPFDDGASGWQWVVRDATGHVWLSTAAAAGLTVAPAPGRAPGRTHRRRFDERRADEPVPAEGETATGEPVHLRQASIETLAGPVSIAASGPRRIVRQPLREALVPLLVSLGLLGLGLGLATIVQLRVGLRPLRTIGAALAGVRAGRLRHVPEDQPEELLPLARELNALIDQNEAGLAHARRHVSNLAHGLKTPLAALSVQLSAPGRDPDGSLRAMVARIDGQVRHHLGRARAAAPGGTGRLYAMLASAVADLVGVLDRIHADRAITASTAIVADMAVAVDPQDLDEMLGNLLDNGWRHARAAVGIGATRAGAMIAITIDDDGPGLSESAIAEALIPGRRLDERGDGHGFGLSIARELAELNGGALMLMPSPAMPGLRAVLTLPVKIGADGGGEG